MIKTKKINVKVCILGAGSGGFGCAWRLLKNGISVAVVDKNPDFGGTSVFSGVSCWEPGVSLDGVHTEIKNALEQIPNGCSVAKTVPNCNIFGENRHTWDFPWGLSVPCDEAYETTLRRSGLDYFTECRRFQFEEDAMKMALNSIISPYSELLTKLFGFELKDTKIHGGRVKSVTVTNGKELCEITADYFVDATGSIALARKLGCETAVGCEEKVKYNEPSAPIEKEDNINGVSYVFRISKAQTPDHIDTVPEEYKSFKIGDKVKTVSCFNCYPNGDININMLPTMTGKEFLELGDKADFNGKAAVWQYWNYLQKNKNMQGFTLTHIFNVGIRENYRLVGKYVLTENDLIKGIKNQDSNRIIAVSDHALDVHGNKSSCPELNSPYGIPIDCCIPKEYDNLLVACRGASFSHIAASSARLSRTMLSLGEGVGEYICELLKDGKFTNNIQGKAYKKFTENYFRRK